MRPFLFAIPCAFMLASNDVQSQYWAPLDPSSGSSVKIVSISPPTGIPLKDGETLAITADVEYVLAAPKGKLGVFVQNDEGRSLLLGSSCPPISSGKGRVSVTASVRVKEANSVLFIVALYHADSRATGVTASRSYVVGDK